MVFNPFELETWSTQHGIIFLPLERLKTCFNPPANSKMHPANRYPTVTQPWWGSSVIEATCSVDLPTSRQQIQSNSGIFTNSKWIQNPYHPWDWYNLPTWMVDFYGFHVGKYTSPMDAMGKYSQVFVDSLFLQFVWGCHLYKRDTPTRWSSNKQVHQPFWIVTSWLPVFFVQDLLFMSLMFTEMQLKFSSIRVVQNRPRKVVCGFSFEWKQPTIH